MRATHHVDARGLETTAVPPTLPSAEAHPDDDRRAELSAETLTPRMRWALLLFTLLHALLVPLTVLGVVISPFGVLDLGAVGLAWIAGLAALSWGLVVVFGALLENNAALRPAERRAWLVLFFALGPAAWLPYFLFHVGPSRHRPHRP